MSTDSPRPDPVFQVHSLFRGAAEVAKRLHHVAFGIDVVVAAVAAYLVFAEHDALEAWHPLVAFLAVALARALRVRSRESDQFAEVCRRESARAYACGDTISPARLSSLRSDAPWGSVREAQELPASTLEAYYEPTCPAGEPRLREMYANSAFHTWHLTRLWSWCLAASFVLLTVTSAAAVYWVANTDGELTGRTEIIEALFSFVLALFWLELAEALYSAIGSYRSARAICQQFLSHPLPAGDALRGLVRDYDFERMSSPAVPTLLYKLDRHRLENEWAECRQELDC